MNGTLTLRTIQILPVDQMCNRFNNLSVEILSSVSLADFSLSETSTCQTDEQHSQKHHVTKLGISPLDAAMNLRIAAFLPRLVSLPPNSANSVSDVSGG